MAGVAANSRIKALYVRSCTRSNAAIVNLGSLIEKNRSIEEVSLISFHPHLSTDVKPLLDSLEKNSTILSLEVTESMLLASNRFSYKPFGLMLKRNTTLRHLTLRHRFSQIDLESIGRGLLSNRTLESLKISNTYLSSPYKTFMKAIRANSSLRSLWLQHCRISKNFPQALSNALGQNTGLTTLRLEVRVPQGRHNILALNNKNASVFLRALHRNSTLKSLSLTLGKVEDSSSIDFRGLSNNKSLTNLELREGSRQGSSLNENSIQALAAALRSNTNLRKLNLVIKENASCRSLLDAIRSNEQSSIVEIKATYPNGLERVPLLDEFNSERRAKMRRELLKSEGTLPWLRSKLMILGEGRAGKSTTVRSLLHQHFEEVLESTVGIKLTEMTTTRNGAWQHEKITDLATHLTSRILYEEPVNTTKEPKPSPTRTVKSDQLNADNATRGGETKTTLSAQGIALPVNPNATTMEGQRRDKREDSAVQEEEFLPFDPVKKMTHYGELQLNTDSEPEAIRMSIWDYGGQSVFHSLSNLFLTEYGMYLIVFDMAELLASKNTTHLKFWLNSVELHVEEAPLILVGTFLDKIESTTGSLREVESILVNELGSALEYCKRPPNNGFSFFPISNRSGFGVDSLRSFIQETTSSQDFVQLPVSIKWMSCLDMLLVNSDRDWVDLKLFSYSANKLGVTSADEIQRMLKLFHELGVLLYFSSTTKLQQRIITNPQWMVDMISTVIRDSTLHGFPIDRLEKAQLLGDLDDLITRGMGSRDLLEALWNRKQVDFLVDLMIQLLLMTPWNFNKKSEMYFVPAMAITANAEEVGDAKYLCKFQFPFLLDGIFERLICVVVNYSQGVAPASHTPVLSRDYSRISLGSKGHIHLRKLADEDVVELGVEKAEACSLAVSLVTSMLQKSKADLKLTGRFSWQVLVLVGSKYININECNKESEWRHTPVDSSEMQLDNFIDMI